MIAISKYRKLAIAAFVGCTIAFIAWLFLAWISFGWAEWICDDRGGDIKACLRSHSRTFVGRSATGGSMWLFSAWLTFRSWGKN